MELLARADVATNDESGAFGLGSIIKFGASLLGGLFDGLFRCGLFLLVFVILGSALTQP